MIQTTSAVLRGHATAPHSAGADAPQRITYLDGWRGFAILAVLVGHFFFDRGINLGRFGVELFFVLSGRLMAEILFVRKTSLRSFFPRRISRIYPVLFVFSTVAFLSAPFLGGDPELSQYLTAVTFTANYAQYFLPHSITLDHIWSLCVEEHMYILLGMLALVHRRRPFPIALVLVLLAGAAMLNGLIQTLMGLDYYEVYWRTDVRGASLLAGAAAFLLLKDGPPLWLAFSWMPILLGVGAVAASLIIVPDPIKYSVGSILLALSLALLPQAPAFAVAVLKHPLLLRVGLWSYSIYLWQQPLYKLSRDMNAENLPGRAGLLAVALGIAVVSYYFIEQPSRRYLNRVWRTEGARAL